MDKMNTAIYASMIFAVIGLLLVANGLTGFVVLTGFDKYTKPLCENTQDCSDKDICCVFENKTSGACMPQDTCQQFLAMPIKTTEPPIELVPPPGIPQIIQLISGLMIVIVTGFMLYYTNKSELNKPKHTK